MMFEPGQKFRYEKDGDEPREYVIVKPSPEQRRQFQAGDDYPAGAVVLLKRTDKKAKTFAAITPEWMGNRCSSPGEWVPIT